MLLTILLALAGVAMAQVEHAEAEPVEFAPETVRAFDRSGRFVNQVKSANGTEVHNHNGSHQMVTVARIGADGQIETLCTDDAEAARRFMETAARTDGDRVSTGREVRK